MVKAGASVSGFFTWQIHCKALVYFCFICKHPVKHQKKKYMNQSMKQHNTGIEHVAKPCTLKELAALYNVSTKTIRTWLLPHQPFIGQKTGRYYTTLQVRIIFDKLGTP